MLSRSAIHAIRALLELAEAPQHWRSVRDLAEAQQLPEALLEQLMLRLRRAGLLEARRGRLGGYRLARPAAAIPLATVLAAVSGGGSAPLNANDDPPTPAPLSPEAAPFHANGSGAAEPPPACEAANRVTAALERRLRQALERELARCSLEDLHHDLRSARAALSEDGGLLLG